MYRTYLIRVECIANWEVAVTYDGINDKLFDLQKSYHKNLMLQDFQVISISNNRKKFEIA